MLPRVGVWISHHLQDSAESLELNTPLGLPRAETGSGGERHGRPQQTGPLHGHPAAPRAPGRVAAVLTGTVDMQLVSVWGCLPGRGWLPSPCHLGGTSPGSSHLCRRHGSSRVGGASAVPTPPSLWPSDSSDRQSSCLLLRRLVSTRGAGGAWRGGVAPGLWGHPFSEHLGQTSCDLPTARSVLLPTQMPGGPERLLPTPVQTHPLLKSVHKVRLFICRGVTSIASPVSLWNRQRGNPAEDAQGQR